MAANVSIDQSVANASEMRTFLTEDTSDGSTELCCLLLLLSAAVADQQITEGFNQIFLAAPAVNALLHCCPNIPSRSSQTQAKK